MREIRYMLIVLDWLLRNRLRIDLFHEWIMDWSLFPKDINNLVETCYFFPSKKVGIVMCLPLPARNFLPSKILIVETDKHASVLSDIKLHIIKTYSNKPTLVLYSLLLYTLSFQLLVSWQSDTYYAMDNAASVNYNSAVGCLTCCCPCITFGRIAEIVDRGSTCKFWNSSIVYIAFTINWGRGFWQSEIGLYLGSMWSEWSTLHIDNVFDGLLMFILLLLSIQVEGSVFLGGKSMPWLFRPLLLWGMRIVSRV